MKYLVAMLTVTVLLAVPAGAQARHRPPPRAHAAWSGANCNRYGLPQSYRCHLGTSRRTYHCLAAFLFTSTALFFGTAPAALTFRGWLAASGVACPAAAFG